MAKRTKKVTDFIKKHNLGRKKFQLGPNQQYWVDELRSGRHKQGRRQLCTETTDGEFLFCCLGLLCYLQDDIEWESEMHEWKCRANGESSWQMEYPPITYANSIKLISIVGSIKNGSGSVTGEHLGYLNDGGWTFAEIAELMERAPQAIFTGPV